MLKPADKPIYEALREAGVSEDRAFAAVQRIRDVAAANLIAQFMAKLDAQDTKLKMLMWMLGAAVAAIGILIRVLG